MVRDNLRRLAGPTLILMPYGPVDAFDETALLETPESFARPHVEFEGREIVFLAVGHKYGAALDVVERLRERGKDAGLVNLRYLKPLPADDLTPLLESAARVVTLEEAVLDGGVGSSVASLITDRGLECDLLRVGLPCTFVEPGSQAELCNAYGLDAAGVLARVVERWPELA